MIIGITGPMCSGKTEFAKTAEKEFGYRKLSFGDEVRLEATARDIPITLENLQKLGLDLREEYGPKYWGNRIVNNIPELDLDERQYVIEGIRTNKDLEVLRDNFPKDFVFIGITAPYNTRLERYLGRKREGDSRNEEMFRLADKKDREEGKNSFGSEELLTLTKRTFENRCKLDKFNTFTYEIIQYARSVV